MGHHICGVLVEGPYDEVHARHYDLIPALAAGGCTLFPIDHYWSAAWQAQRGNVDAGLDVPDDLPAIFPTQGAIRAIAVEITRRESVRFAVIQTDYFGGHGDQWAVLFEGARRLTGCVTVNRVLRELGLVARDGLDEWDTFGLASFRHNPEYLERYVEICDELGV